MKNIWEKHKIKLILFFYLIIMIIFAGQAVFPMADGIRRKADNIQERLIDNEINKSRVSKIPEMEEAYSFFQGRKEATEVILKKDEEVDFIKEIEQIAEGTGNAISLKVVETKDKKTSAKSSDKKKDEEKGIEESLSYGDYIPMQITLKGNYSSLVNFIRRLENYHYYVNVLSMECKKETEVIEKKEQKNDGVIPAAPNLFSSTSLPSDPSSEKYSKERLSSVLNVAIYNKK